MEYAHELVKAGDYSEAVNLMDYARNLRNDAAIYGRHMHSLL